MKNTNRTVAQNIRDGSILGMTQFPINIIGLVLYRGGIIILMLAVDIYVTQPIFQAQYLNPLDGSITNADRLSAFIKSLSIIAPMLICEIAIAFAYIPCYDGVWVRRGTRANIILGVLVLGVVAFFSVTLWYLWSLGSANGLITSTYGAETHFGIGLSHTGEVILSSTGEEWSEYASALSCILVLSSLVGGWSGAVIKKAFIFRRYGKYFQSLLTISEETLEAHDEYVEAEVAYKNADIFVNLQKSESRSRITNAISSGHAIPERLVWEYEHGYTPEAKPDSLKILQYPSKITSIENVDELKGGNRKALSAFQELKFQEASSVPKSSSHEKEKES